MKTLVNDYKPGKFIFFRPLMSLVMFMGCSDGVENPSASNEEELITTVTLTFTPIQGGSGPVSASWKDLDGPGGNPPAPVEDILLENGSFYALTVDFLNESQTPHVDITVEIRAEGVDHQIFYTGSAFGSGLIQHQYDDQDVNGNPLGLINQVTTQIAGSGTFTVTLKHHPGIKSSSTGLGDGNTDVEVTFDLDIQ